MRRIIALALMTVILSFGELALAADDEGTVEKDGVIYKK
jgi:hypothetical protein